MTTTRRYPNEERLALLAPIMWTMFNLTLVYHDAWDLFLSRRAASDAIAFH